MQDTKKIESHFHLKITTNVPEVVEIINKFYYIALNTRKVNSKLLHNPVPNKEFPLLCPMFYVYKCFIYANQAYNANVKFLKNLEKAKKTRDSLIKDYNIQLEDWEQKMIEFYEYLAKKDFLAIRKSTYEYLAKYPNDILMFKVIVRLVSFGSGDKDKYNNLEELLRLCESCEFNYEKNHLEIAKSCGGDHTNYKLTNFVTFLGLKSFLLEELNHFDKAEKLCEIALIYENNLWILHTMIHVYQGKKQIQKSIEVLKDFRRMFKWEDMFGPFVIQHLLWHQSVSHLYLMIDSNAKYTNEEIEKNFDLILRNEEFINACKLFDEYIQLFYRDPQCTLSVFGFLIRVIIYTNSESVKPFESYLADKKDFLEGFVNHVSNKDVYFIHGLNDLLSIWFLSFLGRDNTAQELIKDLKDFAVRAIYINEDNKTFYNITYFEFFQGMLHLGKFELKEAFEILYRLRNEISVVGGSNEQVFVMYEVLIYLCDKLRKVEERKVIVELGNDFNKERQLK